MNQKPSQAVMTAPGPDAASPAVSGREIEIKFRTDRVGIQQALASRHFAAYPPPRAMALRSIYFDTPSGDLHERGIVLRVRKTGRAAPVLGIKRAGPEDGPFARTEMEVRGNNMLPDLSLLDEDTAADLTRLVGDRPLEARFETQVKRKVILFENDRCRVEVALDEGVVLAGDKSSPFAEVELELKSGDEADLYDLAMKLAKDLPLRLDFVSKGERGFRLRAGEAASPFKATRIRFPKNATLDDAVSIVLSSSLTHFVANWAAMRESEHPDAVHQMRVALRRMRAAMAMFNRVLPCSDFDVLRNDAKRIAAALGRARECDVFLEFAEKGPLAHPGCPPNSGALTGAIENSRALAYEDVRALIEDLDTTLFVLRVQSFLARRAWRNAQSGQALAHLGRPALDFAEGALDRLRARVLKRGKGLPDLPDDQRHKARIALKNLRYGAEFLSALFNRRKEAKAFIRDVSALQDILGTHNDAVAAQQFVESLPSTAGGFEKLAGFVLGWTARGTSAADAELASSWNKLKKRKPFW